MKKNFKEKSKRIEDTLQVNRVLSNKNARFSCRDKFEDDDSDTSKTEKVRCALVRYRITPYLIELKRKMILDLFCNPAISVEQACDLLKRTQDDVNELEYAQQKTKRVLDGLSYVQRDMLSEVELGASCADISQMFHVSSRTAFRLISKLDDLICE